MCCEAGLLPHPHPPGPTPRLLTLDEVVSFDRRTALSRSRTRDNNKQEPILPALTDASIYFAIITVRRRCC